MSVAHRLLFAVATILAFAALVLIGAALHKTGTAAFLGAMIAGAMFEIAQRWDRRLRGTHK
jgi:hypothetical protein